MDDTTTSFGGFRLRGGRYERAGYPVAVLPELARYEQLVQDVARGLWKVDNPTRQRIPRGFTEALDLRLIDVDEGSVIPVLERSVSSDDSFDNLFAEAHELIEQAALRTTTEEPLPDRFPRSAMNALLQFGKSLRDDERFEFRWQTDSPIEYTAESRRRLYKRLQVQHLLADGTIVGRITGMQAEARTFDFVTLQGKQLSGRYSDPGMTDDFKEVLHSVAEAPVVRLDGELLWGADDQPFEINEVRSIELFDRDSEPWSERLVSLLSIPRGWLNGGGQPIELHAIEAAREIVRDVVGTGIPVPGLFPMEDGGVQAEWHTRNAILSVEIAPDLTIELHRLGLDDRSESEAAVTTIPEAVRFILEAGV